MNKKTKKLNRGLTLSSSKGFTLVETLVAIIIFTSAILGLVVLSGDSIGNINYVKSKMIATYLAQEGLEYTRNVRDTYILVNTWDELVTDNLNLLSNCKASAGDGSSVGCYINVNEDFSPSGSFPNIIPCNNSCPILYNNLGSYNNEASGDETNFTRTIFVEDAYTTSGDEKQEIKVTSTVSWSKNNKNHQVSLSTFLKNWAEPAN